MRAPLRLLLLVVFFVLSVGNFLHAASPEFPIGDSTLVPAPFGRWQPAIATNGNELFAVWTDSRVPQNRIIGTRLDERGKVLDPTGIPISGETFAPAFQPAVVWNGSSWMVFWTSFIQGAQYQGIIAARIDRDGHLTAPPYMLVAGASGEGQYIASNGDLTVVTYAEVSGTKVHALVLDREGHLVRSMQMPTPWVSLGQSSVATDGSEFVVAWSTLDSPNPAIEAVRLDSAGNLRDSVPTILTLGHRPLLASDGNGYLLLSEQEQENFGRAWASTPIAANLTSGATTLLPDAKLFQTPSLFYRNGNYFVVGQRNSDVIAKLDIAAVLLSRDGLASQPISLADLRLDSVDPQAAATITSTGKVAVIWNEVATDGSWNILTHARLYDGLNRASSPAPILLSGSANPHYGQSIAYGNGIYVIAWRGLDGIYATRVTPNGRAIDGTGLRLEDFGWVNPAIAFDGTNFVVAYAAKESLTLRFLSPVSGLLEQKVTLPRSPGSSGERPALAISPQAIYVAWVDEEYVMMTRIPHATHVPDMPIRVSPPSPVTQPQLAWNGTQLLVGWGLQEFFVTPPIYAPLGIYAARVSATLTLLDPAPLVIAEGDGGYYHPALASNGNEWLFAWQHGGAIEARRVLGDGTLNATALIGEDAWLPVLIFDGARYAMAWKESDPRATLRLATLTANGAIVRSGVATIAATDARPYEAALTATPNGIAVAYAKVSNAPEHGGVERTFLRVMKGKKRAAGF
ncbi:MAG TPA: hypothetical protein VHW00_13735 [Thermoanaerobaculia bacterium]|nr:hypothetical protein [Thermoanaerobaculia bacterium]